MSEFGEEFDALTTELPIFYPDGQVAIQLGPGPSIDFYDDTPQHNLVSSLTPMQWTMGMAGGPQNTMTMSGNQVTNAFPMNNAATPELRAGEIVGSVITNGTNVSEQFTLSAPILSAFPESISVYSLSPTLENNGAGPVGAHAKVGIAYTDNEGVDPAADLFGIDVNAATFAVPARSSRSWTALTPQNGWSSAVTPNPPWAARLGPGRVEFRGTLTGGTNTDGTLIGTLPAGFFDTTFQAFAAIGYTGGTGQSRVTINPSTGAMTIAGMSVAPGFIQFDGFSLPIP